MAVNINRDLAQWLIERVEEGTPEKQVRRNLHDHGYDRVQVQSLCDFAYRNTKGLYAALAQFDHDIAHETEQDVPLFASMAALELPDDNSLLSLTHDGGPVRILASVERPHVVLLGNFLSDAECDALMALGHSELRRAEVVHRETGNAVIDDRRTSDYATFQRGEHPLLVRIEERIERLTGLPTTHGEGIQVMRYSEGAEYRPHFDFFDPDGAFMRRRSDTGGQRVATLVMYLNDAPAGGATVFPDAGLAIRPHKGCAVYFAYTTSNGECDNLSFHGGAPVVRGEKWIASKWLRTKPYFSDAE